MKSIVYRNQSFVNKKYHKSIVQFIASYIYDCCNLWFDLPNLWHVGFKQLFIKHPVLISNTRWHLAFGAATSETNLGPCQTSMTELFNENKQFSFHHRYLTVFSTPWDCSLSSQNFPKKKKNSYPLICTRTCAYQGVRNDIFLENIANALHAWYALGFILIEKHQLTLAALTNLEIYLFWLVLSKIYFSGRCGSENELNQKNVLKPNICSEHVFLLTPLRIKNLIPFVKTTRKLF